MNMAAPVAVLPAKRRVTGTGSRLLTWISAALGALVDSIQHD